MAAPHAAPIVRFTEMARGGHVKFKKEFLLEVLDSGEVILDSIVDHERWSITHRLVFEHEGKLYETTYDVGATESQDHGPFDYRGDVIECSEVEAYERTVIEYRKVGAVT